MNSRIITIELDEIDKTILNYLMENSKNSIQVIAKNIGISGPAVHQRIKKMEHNGVILSSRVIIDSKKIGYKLIAYIGVFIDKSSSYKYIINELHNIPQVLEAHYTTGNYSIFLKICCKDNNHLMEILSKSIQNINGILRTETFISLEQNINREIKP